MVAGPDPGHAFPAIALSLLFRAAGDEPILFTGSRWVPAAHAAGLGALPLGGLAPRPEDDDLDAGQRIHSRAAFVSTELLPDLERENVDLVVSDILTAGVAWPPSVSVSPGSNSRPILCIRPRKGCRPSEVAWLRVSGFGAGCAMW